MKEHWENIYANKGDQDVSWYQAIPTTSIQLIENHLHQKEKPVIDIGGGNSNLTSELTKKGFSKLNVLDISKNALERTSKKLGEKSNQINWINSNVLELKSDIKYSLWHDRAVFHFLTTQQEKEAYKQVLLNLLDQNGIFILSTFSKSGPLKCSGLNISQYDIEDFNELFSDSFELIETFTEDHTTPFDTTQNFIYSVWRKKKS